MAHHRRSPPTFFKILLDPSAPHLPLPPDFVSKHLEHKVPKDLTVRSAKGGYSWRLKIKKIGESLCLCDGWESVVEDIQLGFGDFLVFRVVDKLVFNLVVYSPNGCEKEFVHKTHVEDDDSVVVEDNNNINNNNNNNNNNINNDDDDVVVEDDVVEEVEDGDGDGDEDEDEYEDEEDVEGYEEKDDDDDDDDDEGDGDDDGEGGIDGHDGDPFFMMNISKAHKSMMRLPPDFVELAGIEGEGTLTVANVDGKEWQLGVRVEKHFKNETYCLSAGWGDFQLSNDICEGDECVFKFLRNEDKLLLARVTKNKRPARHPLGKKMANGVAKRKREQAEHNSGQVSASKVNGDDEDHDQEKEDEDDVDEDKDDGSGDIDGDEGDPFFRVNISKTHKSFMRLPPEFVELAGIEGDSTLKVANVDGKEWQLGVRVDKQYKAERCYLSAGWVDFRRSNDLCEGDECVFKFLRNEDKLLLARVTKNKQPARHPFGKKMTNGVAKRKREQAEHNSGQVSASKVDGDDEDQEKEDEDDVDEDKDDGDGSGDIDGDEGDPFFRVNTSKTHMTMMRLPPDFVELAGIDGERTLTAVNVDGKEWQLGVRLDKYHKRKVYCLSAGWREFWRSNDICEGDECVFKFIRSEDKLLLERVTKNKRLTRHRVGKKIANGVAKRKREQPERNSRKGPARKVETRAAHGGGAVQSVKGVKRSRGRPAKRLRGKPARRK